MEEIEVTLAQVLEERTRCLDVSRRVGAEDDHIFQVGRYLSLALDNLFDNLDEPPGRSTAALGHDVPFIEARGSAKRSERDGFLVRSNLMERRNHVEQEKIHPLPIESRIWSTRGMGSWLLYSLSCF